MATGAWWHNAIIWIQCWLGSTKPYNVASSPIQYKDTILSVHYHYKDETAMR